MCLLWRKTMLCCKKKIKIKIKKYICFFIGCLRWWWFFLGRCQPPQIYNGTHTFRFQDSARNQEKKKFLNFAHDRKIWNAWKYLKTLVFVYIFLEWHIHLSALVGPVYTNLFWLWMHNPFEAWLGAFDIKLELHMLQSILDVLHVPILKLNKQLNYLVITAFKLSSLLFFLFLF